MVLTVGPPRVLMIMHEILLTCSNPSVARAAVASIGGDFAGWFDRQAANRNLSSGLVRGRVGSRIRPLRPRTRTGRASGRGDARRRQPILSGLRYILDRGLDSRR